MKKLVLVFILSVFAFSPSALATTTKCSAECTDFSGIGPYFWISLNQCEDGFICQGINDTTCTKSQESEVIEGHCVAASSQGSGTSDYPDGSF